MYSGLDSAADSSHVEGSSIKTLEIVYFHVILASFAVRFFFFCFFLLNFLETATLYSCLDYVQAKAVRLNTRFF